MKNQEVSDRAAILTRRAERLAAPTQPAESPLLNDEAVMIFRLAADRFALPLSALVQVLPQSKLAAVPGAPSEVAGLIQIRGEVLPIYHLGQLLGLAPALPDSGGVLLLLQHPAGDFGIAVDEVQEVRAVPKNGRRLMAQQAKGHAGWMTEDLIPVLSVELLLGDN